MTLTSARLESRAARSRGCQVVDGSGSVVFVLRQGGGLHELVVRGEMVVIRRPFNRFASQGVQAAGAGRGAFCRGIASRRSHQAFGGRMYI